MRKPPAFSNANATDASPGAKSYVDRAHLTSHSIVRIGALNFLVPLFISSAALAQEAPRDLASFFGGHLIATGKIQDYQDGSRGVRVDIRGTPDKGAFKVVLNTTFSDGERQHHIWKFTKSAGGGYIGQRADLIGQAAVAAHGNKIELAYRARVRMKDGTAHDLNFKESFVFTQSGTADYRLQASLLFIQVGEAHLTVRKQFQ